MNEPRAGIDVHGAGQRDNNHFDANGVYVTGTSVVLLTCHTHAGQSPW